MRASPTLSARERELAAIVDEDLDRLQGLVTDAVQMLRIEAGDVAVHIERQRIADVVEAALRKFESRLDGHDLVKRVPEGLMVDADRELLSVPRRGGP